MPTVRRQAAMRSARSWAAEAKCVCVPAALAARACDLDELSRE
jgi:hypothetical protein